MNRWQEMLIKIGNIPMGTIGKNTSIDEYEAGDPIGSEMEITVGDCCVEEFNELFKVLGKLT